MSKDTNDLEQLQNEIKVDQLNVLFLDISSTCTGYAIAHLDFITKTPTWKSAGAIWLDNKATHQEKYLYMHEAIVNYFWIIQQVDYIVVEQYSINPKKMAGVHVVPEMQGAIKAAAAQNGVKVVSILPQSWRSQLKIQKVQLPNGSNDFKGPTEAKIRELVEVPELSISNITKKERRTPSDLYDAMGVGLGWLLRLGFTTGDFSNIEFNPHIGSDIGEI